MGGRPGDEASVLCVGETNFLFWRGRDGQQVLDVEGTPWGSGYKTFLYLA